MCGWNYMGLMVKKQERLCIVFVRSCQRLCRHSWTGCIGCRCLLSLGRGLEWSACAGFRLMCPEHRTLKRIWMIGYIEYKPLTFTLLLKTYHQLDEIGLEKMATSRIPDFGFRTRRHMRRLNSLQREFDNDFNFSSSQGSGRWTWSPAYTCSLIAMVDFFMKHSNAAILFIQITNGFFQQITANTRCYRIQSTSTKGLRFFRVAASCLGDR